MVRSFVLAAMAFGGCAASSTVPAAPEPERESEFPSESGSEAESEFESESASASESASESETVHRSGPTGAGTSGSESDAVAYPGVYCGFVSDESGRWEVRLDPDSSADQRRVVRLLKAYPDADGIRKGLARSNLPTQWQGITDVTLLNEHGRTSATVKRIGVRVSPSEGRFAMVLDAKPSALAGEFALVVAGTFSETAKVRTVRKDGTDVDLGSGANVDVRRWLRTADSRGAALDDPSVRFEAVGAVDLDGSGDEELIVFEHWVEGLYVWLVRFDGGAGRLHAERLCGDAA
jgi:hypothetical protein